MDERALGIIALGVGIAIAALITALVARSIPERSTSNVARSEGEPSFREGTAEAAPSRTSSPAVLALPTPAPSANPGIGLGVFIAILGALIALIGLAMGLAADTGNSAPRQAVAALWTIAGLIGLVIAAIGTGIAAITHVLKSPR